MNKRFLIVAAAALCAGCGAAPNPETEARAAAAAPMVPWEDATNLTPELTQVKAGLERYRDPVAAIHDGYLSTVGCIEYPAGGSEGTIQYQPGGMGVHFINMSYVGPTLDPTKPQVLIYEPVGDSLRLAAAEWFMPLQAAGDKVPQIFGKPLDGPMGGHPPLLPEGLHHYDLHVWLWRNNPSGVFSSTNPSVKCPKAAYSFQEAAPKLVEHGH